MSISTIPKAIEYIKQGKFVLIKDDHDREDEFDVAFSARHVTLDLIKLCQYKASGLLCIALSNDKADQIGLKRIKANKKDKFQTPFGLPLSYANMKDSPVSVEGRRNTIFQLSKKNITINDFVYPGHVATLIAHSKGLLARRGHTEAVIDLLALSNEPPAGVLCEVQSKYAGMAGINEVKEIFAKDDYLIVSIQEIKESIQKVK